MTRSGKSYHWLTAAIIISVPAAGDVPGSIVIFADIAVMISILQALGNAAFDVHTMAGEPSKAQVAILPGVSIDGAIICGLDA
jgi:hypothetical protein